MIARNENNFINAYSQYRQFHSRYLVQKNITLPSRYSSDRTLCTYTLSYRLLVLNYATLTAHRCA